MIGIFASYRLDMPTGAAVVATFGALLAIAVVKSALSPRPAAAALGAGSHAARKRMGRAS